MSSFIANPQIIDYVKIDTSLEINLQKLNQLRDFQIKNINQSNQKHYVIKVCKGRCASENDNIIGKLKLR